MTLTEQWKKGELSEGYYYFKMPDGVMEIASEYRLIRYKLTKDAEKIEVLAPVPSYEEWKSTGKFAMEAMKVAEENQQLKELLSKCLDELAEFNNSYYPETQELFSQITNAIGENNAKHCRTSESDL